jgi:phage protein D
MAGEVAVPIFSGDQDFYVPFFQVKIGGKAQGQDVVRDILSVSYKEDLLAIDTFEININNWDAKTLGFKYSDASLFDPGQEVELWMGYYNHDSKRLMVRGQITGLHPSFPSGGGSTLVVSGLNLLHKLRTEKRSFTYEKMTDSQIAKEIARLLKIDVRAKNPDEKEYGVLMQQDEYDIVFLMQRARFLGYDLFVEEVDDDGVAHPPLLVFERSTKVRRAAYELKYGRSLIDFKPDLTTANQVSEVTVRGWDSVNKKKIEYTAKRSEIDVKGVGKAGNQQAIEESFKQRREIISTKPIASVDEAKTMAVRALEENAKDMVKATGSTVGLPDLRAGSVLMIGGVGARFTGRYFVTATTHAIGDSGYTTQFECRREDVQ